MPFESVCLFVNVCVCVGVRTLYMYVSQVWGCVSQAAGKCLLNLETELMKMGSLYIILHRFLQIALNMQQ